MRFLHVQRRRAGLAAIGGKLRTLRILLMYGMEQAPATGVLQRNWDEEVKGGGAKARGLNYSRKGRVLYSPLPH